MPPICLRYQSFKTLKVPSPFRLLVLVVFMSVSGMVCQNTARAEESGWQEIGVSLWFTDRMYLEMSREARHNSVILFDNPYYANLKAAVLYNVVYFDTGLQ